MTEIERLYRGEIAFLKEVKAQRDKARHIKRKREIQKNKRDI